MAQLGHAVNKQFLDGDENGLRAWTLSQTRHKAGLAQWKICGYLYGIPEEKILENRFIKQSLQYEISRKERGVTQVDDDLIDALCVIANLNREHIWKLIKSGSAKAAEQLTRYIARQAWTGYAIGFVVSLRRQKMLRRYRYSS